MDVNQSWYDERVEAMAYLMSTLLHFYEKLGFEERRNIHGNPYFAVVLPPQRVYTKEEVTRHVMHMQSEIYLYRGLYIPLEVVEAEEDA